MLYSKSAQEPNKPKDLSITRHYVKLPSPIAQVVAWVFKKVKGFIVYMNTPYKTTKVPEKFDTSILLSAKKHTHQKGQPQTQSLHSGYVASSFLSGS